MADGAKKLCSGDYVLEDGVRVGPYKMVWRPGEGRRKPLDAGSTGPVVIGNLGGGLCPAPDVFRLTCWWWWCGTPFLQEKSVLLSRRPAKYLVYGRLLSLSIRWPVSLLCHTKKNLTVSPRRPPRIKLDTSILSSLFGIGFGLRLQARSFFVVV